MQLENYLDMTILLKSRTSLVDVNPESAKQNIVTEDILFFFFFFFFYRENKSWHLMWIVCLSGNDIFLKN